MHCSKKIPKKGTLPATLVKFKNSTVYYNGMRGKIILLTLVLGFFFFCFSTIADSGSLLGECEDFCSAKDYQKAADCFAKDRDKSDAYLAVATCAFNNYDDNIAEDYALKAAADKNKWTSLLSSIGINAGRTGGLGEIYVLAYVASGGSRHQDDAIKYLKNSGQCYNSEDKENCAGMYFNSVVARYESRSVQGSRTSAVNPRGKSLSGKVTDQLGKPLKNAYVVLSMAGKEYKTLTDSSGNYMFSYTSDMSVWDLSKNVEVTVFLRYIDPKDNKTYYRIMFNNNPAKITKKISLAGEASLRQDIEVKKDLPAAAYSAYPGLNYMEDYGVIYTHMQEVLEFFKDNLKADVDYKLPVDVLPNVLSDSTYYTPATGSIIIKHSDSRITDSDRPRNREFHEFSHHVMYSMYTQWPRPPKGAEIAEINHDGYINPNTADSFTEGFAEFMALVVADHYNQGQKGIYASFGSLDVDWKAWSKRGKYEEFAIAGILWDLYDEKNDDKVQLKFEDIWRVLKVYNDDFTEVYEALIKNHPLEKEEIDEIFVKHGFFADKTEGNKRRDPEEPFRDKNGNNAFDEGEYFIDYAQEPGLGKPWMIHQDNEKIGSATNYERQSRRNAVRFSGNYIKVDNSIPTYIVKAEFPDNPELNYEVLSDNDDGFVYVEVPPAEYRATVKVMPEGYMNAKPLFIKSEEWEEAMAEADDRGYYIEHDFGVSGVAVQWLEPQKINPGLPYWEWDEKAKDSDYEYKGPVWSNEVKNKRLSWLWVIIVIIVVSSLLFIVFARLKKIRAKKKQEMHRQKKQ